MRDFKEFIFVRNDDNGAFMARDKYDFLSVLQLEAKRNNLWGILGGGLGAYGRSYLGFFHNIVPNAPDLRALAEEPLAMLNDELWILSEDQEFPVVNAFEETYAHYKDYFPLGPRRSFYTTMYGEEIGIFGADEVEDLVIAGTCDPTTIINIHDDCPYDLGWWFADMD